MVFGHVEALFDEWFFEAPSRLRDEQGGLAHTSYGMALYRLDRWEEARGLLQIALQINGDNAIDLAFLAMCEHRLGESAVAQATHQRLRELLASQQYAFNPDDQEVVDEVEALLGAPTRITRSSR